MADPFGANTIDLTLPPTAGSLPIRVSGGGWDSRAKLDLFQNTGVVFGG
jgi:hypothetical protein